MKVRNNLETPQITHLEDDTDQSIGHILVRSGRLSPEAAEEIHRRQKDNGLLFGETGIAMGLLSREDVEFAIATQFDYSVLKRGSSKISEDLATAYDPFGSAAEAFRELRTELLLGWHEADENAKILSVISARRGEGRSYVAANLAVSFSQLGLKTLLVDTDFRNARLHAYFGVPNRRGLSSLLQNKSTFNFFLPVNGIRNLFILPSGPLPPNPQELLSQGAFADLLAEFTNYFDILILDTPAALSYSDAATVAKRSHASIVVARQDHTKADELTHLSDNMHRHGGKVLGSVLLDF
ncbi:MAG: polysaccharide biosynthesis tyrosine autokinase [Limnobacter sp.]|uniref:polysaccharide biosynthesis tyrosine autokinase n=1 Tax=Limnobacter sp. TaxID=2003368 RepID=UPI0032EC96CB